MTAMTDQELLVRALSGKPEEVEKLYAACLDRPHAEAFARLLEQHATQSNDMARAWASVLEEWHPGLKVNLPPVS